MPDAANVLYESRSTVLGVVLPLDNGAGHLPDEPPLPWLYFLFFLGGTSGGGCFFAGPTYQ